ncbi:MAG: hypothetical protein PHP42_07365 [Bacteroidota bacterium]|nr:hypothetical protein [Bacteroidota bacterium]
MNNFTSGSLLPIQQLNSEGYHPIFVRFFVIGIVFAFGIVHSPMLSLQHWYDTVIVILYANSYIGKTWYDLLVLSKAYILQQYITPIRSILFFLSLIIIFVPLVKSLILFFADFKTIAFSKEVVKKTFVSFFVLAILIFPLKLGIMSVGYAQMSFNPFGIFDESGQLYQRILMPALAYFFQLQGPLLYHVFSLLCTVFLLWLIILFFQRRGINLSNIELISIGTSSFVITQMQSPGYTEPLAYIAILILFIVPTSTYSRLSLVTLAILSHEISALFVGIIALFYFTKVEKFMTGVIFCFYALFWMMNYGFDIGHLLHVRNVGDVSAVTWLIQYPWREVFGVLVSLKLLWIVYAIALYQMKSERKLLISLFVAGIFLTFGGVDTSRLMGYVLIGLFISFFRVKKFSLLSRRALNAIVIFNVMIPSVYIGTNSGIVFFNGLYQLLYTGVLLR